MTKLESRTNKVARKKGIIFMLIITTVVFGVVGVFYWQTTKNQIYTDKAEISAPIVALSSAREGELKKIFVKVGDVIQADTVVAQIGDETIKTTTPGLVLQISNNIGENFSANESVVTIINPAELRVIAQVEENKGLKDIAIGQQVMFKVDAFGNQKFFGTVDEVAATSREAGIVFNISDKREVKSFDIKIKFDQKQYVQLKNGMSAKVWIYTK